MLYSFRFISQVLSFLILRDQRLKFCLAKAGQLSAVHKETRRLSHAEALTVAFVTIELGRKAIFFDGGLEFFEIEAERLRISFKECVYIRFGAFGGAPCRSPHSDCF